MIRCNVTVIGTVCRPADLKDGRNDNLFVTFGLRVQLKDGQESHELDVSVACDGEDNDILGLAVGSRVKVKGVMTLRKFGDTTYFNLSAEKVYADPKEADSISGKIQFRGRLGSKEIIERQGKKGGFRTFEAYSSEQVGEQQYSYIWVHFIDFSQERPYWLVPRAGIEAEGKLELQVYDGRVNVSCRVESLSEWAKDITSK